MCVSQRDHPEGLMYRSVASYRLGTGNVERVLEDYDVAYADKGLDDRAIDDYDKAIELNLDFAEAYLVQSIGL